MKISELNISIEDCDLPLKVFKEPFNNYLGF